MNFGEVLECIKKGSSACRHGWNGKGMYIYLEEFEDYRTDGLGFEPAIIMYTAQKTYQPGWLASQNDMLAEDWEVFEK